MTTTARRTICTVGVLLVGTAARSAAQTGRGPGAERLDPRLLGCYQLFGSRGESAAGSLYWAPAAVRLDTATSTLRGDSVPRLRGVLVRLDTGAAAARAVAHSSVVFNRWYVDAAGDTLRVFFSSGFSGTTFALGLARARAGGTFRDTLVGRATEHWDSGPPFSTPRGRAFAVRTPCPT